MCWGAVVHGASIPNCDVLVYASPCSDPKAVQQGAEEARFDRMRRELTWAARGAPGERTRTSEELAELERLRLEVPRS